MNKDKFQGVKVFYDSCHASIEYDMGSIFGYLGMSVGKGNLSQDHLERPVIRGITDVPDFGPVYHMKKETLTFVEEDFEGTDFVFFVNPSDFQNRIGHYAKYRPVVMYLNGQWVDHQLDELASKINGQWDRGEKCNIFVAVYSKREERELRRRIHTQLQNRIHHIRFAKKKEDYTYFAGGSRREGPANFPFVYTSCHSIHHRPDSCCYPQWQEIVKGFPHLLSGRHTDQIGGMGLLTWEQLRILMSICRVYVSVPCWPAPIVLNMVEAMMCGAPISMYENERGLAEEGLFDGGVGNLTKDISSHRDYIKRCFNEPSFREDQSHLVLNRALEFFEFESQAEKWGDLFSVMFESRFSGKQI